MVTTIKKAPKAGVVRELVLVTLPIIVAVVIGDLIGSDRTDLPGDVAILQGRNLWPLVLSHAFIDTIDFISHYFESTPN